MTRRQPLQGDQALLHLLDGLCIGFAVDHGVGQLVLQAQQPIQRVLIGLTGYRQHFLLLHQVHVLLEVCHGIGSTVAVCAVDLLLAHEAIVGQHALQGGDVLRIGILGNAVGLRLLRLGLGSDLRLGGRLLRGRVGHNRFSGDLRLCGNFRLGGNLRFRLLGCLRHGSHCGLGLRIDQILVVQRQVLQRQRIGNAGHLQLEGRILLRIDVLLEIAHGCAGDVVVAVGGAVDIQPLQLSQALLQLSHLLRRGGLVHLLLGVDIFHLQQHIQRCGVGIAGYRQNLLALDGIDIVLEVGQCGVGQLAEHAVHLVGRQEAILGQHALQRHDGILVGVLIQAAVLGSFLTLGLGSHFRLRSCLRRLRGLGGSGSGLRFRSHFRHGGGLGGRLSRGHIGRRLRGIGCGSSGAILLSVQLQVIPGQLVHSAGGLQHGLAEQLVHAQLELDDRIAGLLAVCAVHACGIQQVQGDQHLLHALDQLRLGVLIDDRLHGGGGLNRRRQRRNLSRLGSDGLGILGILILHQQRQRLLAGNAVYRQLFAELIVGVHKILEILDGLNGGGIVLAGHVGLVQPALLYQHQLQAGDLLLGGLGVDGLVGLQTGIRGGSRLYRGNLGGLGSRIVLGLLVELLIHIAVIDLLHPVIALIIHIAGDGGGHVRRGRGQLQRLPFLFLGHILNAVGAVQRAAQHVDDAEHHDGHNGDYRHGDAHDGLHIRAVAILDILVVILIAHHGRSRGSGALALYNVTGAVLFKEEMAVGGVLRVLHGGLDALQAGVKLILHAGGGHNRAVGQAAGAIPREILADAQLALQLQIQRGIYHAVGVLSQGAAHQEASAIDDGAGQQLHLRHCRAGISAAMRAHGLPVGIFKTIHTQILVSHYSTLLQACDSVLFQILVAHFFR